LALREDPEKGCHVAGLSEHCPSSADEVMKLLELGNSRRTQHPTDANAQSSRSHAVLQVLYFVETRRWHKRTHTLSHPF
jgi:kinesin family protein 18/19